MIIQRKDIPAFLEFLREGISERNSALLDKVDIMALPVGVRPDNDEWRPLEELI